MLPESFQWDTKSACCVLSVQRYRAFRSPFEHAVRTTLVMHASLKLVTHSVALTGGGLPHKHGAEPGGGGIHAERGRGGQPAAAQGAVGCGRW